MIEELECWVADERSLPADFDELYRQLWWSMLRLATGLLDDAAAAEDVVQDSFAGLFRRWDAMRDPGAAAGYLRISVVNGCRSVLRRRGTARKYLRVGREETTDAADHMILLEAEHKTARDALARLPERQREVLTLRYLSELSDAEIAQATGLSAVGVRSTASRGLAALRRILGEM